MEIASKKKENRIKNGVFIFCVITLFLMVKCGYSQTIEELAAKKFHGLINQYRIEHGKKALILDEKLCKSADAHNKWMLYNNKFQHNEIKGTKGFVADEVWDRVAVIYPDYSDYSLCGENCYRYSGVGENDKNADFIANEAFKAWKKSKYHNENMLDAYDKHGISFVLRDNTLFATDVFYSPMELVSK